jgi:signal transduction histidine kinase
VNGWTGPEPETYDRRVESPPGPVARRMRPPSTIRGALAVGFLAVFALWTFSAYDLLRGIAQVEERVTEARDSFIRGERVLSTIRTSVLLGSVYLRDALVDSGAITRQYYRDELNQIREDISVMLPAYVSGVHSPIERQQWALLQTELDDYWGSTDVVFGPDMPRSAGGAATFLRERIVPRRDTILRILDRLTALRSVAEQRHQIETSLMYAEVRQRLISTGVLSILLGIVVAVLATWYVGRLQREIEQQREVDVQNRRDLERLSARLVSAQEEERRVIARELHDEVGQALTAIKMELGVAQRGVRSDSREAASLAEARTIAEAALQNVRDMSQLLHPSMLDDFGLPETLQTYLRGFSKRSGIRAQITTERMEERLPADVEVGLYRIVQEALTNVLKHANATSCTVRVVRRDDHVHLTVDDDGRGIERAVDPAGPARRGLGIIGMRERAASLAGTFSIQNRPEGGTHISVRLPLTPSGVLPFPATERRAG